MRESVSAEERLVATLRFLATGRSYEDLKFSSIISPQLLGQLIPETCQRIYDVLRENYLKVCRYLFALFLFITSVTYKTNHKLATSRLARIAFVAL